MAHEIELKLDAPAKAAERLPKIPSLEKLLSAPLQRKRVASVYFDIRSGKLRQAGIYLRVRRSGAKFQTVKRDPKAAYGAFTRREWEREMTGEEPDAAHSDSEGDGVQGRAFAPRCPSFGIWATITMRRHRLLAFPLLVRWCSSLFLHSPDVNFCNKLTLLRQLRGLCSLKQLIRIRRTCRHAEFHQPTALHGKRRRACRGRNTRGSRAKFAYDPKLETFALTKSLLTGLSYPHDWGFVPSTKVDDGDPLDIMVIHDAATFPGLVVTCRVIGILQIEQKSKNKSERNDRLFAPYVPPL
jgi:Inorganic pyrophosphatase/CYTH domain